MSKETSIRESLRNFNAFLAHGNLDSAVVYLASAYYCLPHLTRAEAIAASMALDEVSVTPNLIDVAVRQVAERVRRIDRIISVGSKWDDLEILLLLGLRVDIEVLLFFLKRFNVMPEFDLSEIDIWFEYASKSVANKGSFDWATKQIRKNSKLAGYTKWV
ncbi:MAG: hypothetical protein AB7J13_04095 [Pyrinomonadaceae bacterium]